MTGLIIRVRTFSVARGFVPYVLLRVRRIQMASGEYSGSVLIGLSAGASIISCYRRGMEGEAGGGRGPQEILRGLTK